MTDLAGAEVDETGNVRSLSPLLLYMSVSVLLFRRDLTLIFVSCSLTDGMLNTFHILLTGCGGLPAC